MMQFKFNRFCSKLFKNILIQTTIRNTSTLSNSNMKVFVTQPIQANVVEFMKSQNIDLVINEQLPLQREKFLELAKDCDGLFCTLNEKIDEELLNMSLNLKVVATCSVGYDHVDKKACDSRNIKVGYTPGVLTDATAELTIGLLLNTSRLISHSINSAKAGEWGNWKITWMCGHGLSGSKVGILGLGRIGLAVAKRLLNFNTNKIIYHNRHVNPEGDQYGLEYVDLQTLLAESDFLICTCALTNETKDFFNLETFKKMKKNAIFVNVSRGGVVNQEDLCTALRQNIIYAAGLDVTIPEPLPTDHELFKLPNCFITPHIASAEFSTRNRMAMITAVNLVEGLNLRPMLHQIK